MRFSTKVALLILIPLIVISLVIAESEITNVGPAIVALIFLMALITPPVLFLIRRFHQKEIATKGIFTAKMAKEIADGKTVPVFDKTIFQSIVSDTLKNIEKEARNGNRKWEIHFDDEHMAYKKSVLNQLREYGYQVFEKDENMEEEDILIVLW